jgi:cytochrome bd-type quinol oxidase subunit 2
MPSWKLWLRRRLAVFVLLIVAIASLLAGLLLPYLLAEWSAKIWFLAVSSVCAFAVVAWAGAWLGALIWRAERRRKFAGTFSVLCSTVFVIALYALILRPNPSRLTETSAPTTRATGNSPRARVSLIVSTIHPLARLLSQKRSCFFMAVRGCPSVPGIALS